MGDVVWTDEAREAAVDAAARRARDMDNRRNGDILQEFDDMLPMHQFAYREAELPFVTAAMNALAPHVEAMVREARAEALDQAADALVWKRPEKSPCVDFESCCGSEAHCDAMTPSASVVGEDWLRSRAEEVRRGE